MSAQASVDVKSNVAPGFTGAETQPSALAASPSPSPSLLALPKLKGKHRGLLPAIIGLLTIALGAVLAINIHLGNSQYDLVQLQNDREALTQQNQALSEQLQHLQSPQSLSSSAVDLGMVMPAQAGALDLDNAEVIASADAAESADRPSSFVSEPITPGQDVTAPIDVSDRAAGAPSGMLGGGALNTLNDPAAGQNGGGTDSSAEDSGSGFSAEDLNGGTVPAPGLD